MAEQIHKNKTRLVTVQATIDGVPTGNAENLVAFENGSSFLEITPVQVATAPFTFNVKAGDFVGQLPLVRYTFDGHVGAGLVEVPGEVQFEIVEEDANGSIATVGPEF